MQSFHFRHKKMKILIGCPTYEKYESHIDYWLDAVKKIINFSKEHKIDYLLVDNSKSNDFFEGIRAKGANIVRAPYSENAKERIVNSRNILREKVLNEGYNFFFSLEQDVIPEEDIIKKLLFQNKKIVSAYYGKQQELTVQDKETGEIKKIIIEMPIAYVQEGNLIRRAFPQELLNKGLIKVGALGLGCLLISSEVLKKIKFRFEKDKKAYDDMYFCQDAKKLGYELFLNSEIKVKHLWKDWTKEK